MASNQTPLRIVLIAGEASGDLLGARMMAAMKTQHQGSISFSGVGGPLMESQGLQSLFPMNELSLMGILEILPSIPRLLQRIRQTADHIRTNKPDAVITIDSPDFSFRVAQAVQKDNKRECPWVHYVAPTVWAWRAERAAKVAKLYDGVICLLPFEPPYFTREGMKAVFAGHPAIENVGGFSAGQAFRERHRIPLRDAFLFGVLFGSRRSEIKRMGETIRESVLQVLAKAQRPDVHIVAPTFPHLKDEVATLLKDMPCPVHIVTDPTDKWPAFDATEVALAISGTVGLELAVASVPHVIAYRMNPVTWEIVRRKVKVPYAHLANILMEDRVVPESIQDRCRSELISEELLPLFNPNGAASTSQRNAFMNLKHRIRGDGDGTPPEQAARFVLSLI
jgi:lipid-A-disaccharide synthase